MILSTHLFCLLNLSTTPQLCPPLLLSYTFDVLDHIHQHKQPNTMCDLLCTMHYALCIIYYALCTIHYALCTMHMHYALCICTMHYALFTMHYVICIRIYTYSYVFTILYVFIRIHTYSLFHMEIRRNPVILILTRSSRRIE